jgi:hypothetical protein
MSESQKTALSKLLGIMGPDVFYHDDTVGSAEQAHVIALLDHKITVVTYPPDNPDLRAYLGGVTYTAPTAPYMDQNHNMVDVANALIITPSEFVQKPRSACWATYRYAKREKKALYVIYPDGRIRVSD